MKLNSARRKMRKPNIANQSFESQGPEGKIRGTAHQIFDKYIILARDANSSGDRVAAESFYQYAEHYYRLIHTDNENEPSHWYEDDRHRSSGIFSNNFGGSEENKNHSQEASVLPLENGESSERERNFSSSREGGKENRFENRRSRHPFSDRMNRHRSERANTTPVAVEASVRQKAETSLPSSGNVSSIEETEPSADPFITVLQ